MFPLSISISRPLDLTEQSQLSILNTNFATTTRRLTESNREWSHQLRPGTRTSNLTTKQHAQSQHRKNGTQQKNTTTLLEKHPPVHL